MPITKQEFELETDRDTFELGIDRDLEELMGKVYDFLKSHQDSAFSMSELEQQDGIIPYKLRRALEVLVEKGAVAQSQKRSQMYYAFLREVDKNTWKPKSQEERIRKLLI